METIGISDSQVQKRNLVSSVFVSLLLALAYEELLPSVKNYIGTQGFDLSLISMFLIFFLTSSRFFIGAILHLISDELTVKPGKVWFLDFSVIVIEMIAFILLAGMTSPSNPAIGPINFIGVLIFILLLDLIWVVVQSIMSERFSGWKRNLIPWGWGTINFLLLVAIGVLWIVAKDLLMPVSLAVIAVLNIPAFIGDVILLDHYDLF